ncbi:MAG TPA: hypothetical protein VFG72_13305 [Marmoricola sp.]|nr:hypothetical protein [Marmoricola sp.]
MSDKNDGGRPHKAGAFDIRVFIGVLLGLYGVILVLTGLLGTSDRDLERAGGANVNLWAGVGLVLVSVFFVVWARLRPVVVPPDAGASDDEG